MNTNSFINLTETRSHNFFFWNFNKSISLFIRLSSGADAAHQSGENDLPPLGTGTSILRCLY